MFQVTLEALLDGLQERCLQVLCQRREAALAPPGASHSAGDKRAPTDDPTAAGQEQPASAQSEQPTQDQQQALEDVRLAEILAVVTLGEL